MTKERYYLTIEIKLIWLLIATFTLCGFGLGGAFMYGALMLLGVIT